MREAAGEQQQEPAAGDAGTSVCAEPAGAGSGHCGQPWKKFVYVEPPKRVKEVLEEELYFRRDGCQIKHPAAGNLYSQKIRSVLEMESKMLIREYAENQVSSLKQNHDVDYQPYGNVQSLEKSLWPIICSIILKLGEHTEYIDVHAIHQLDIIATKNLEKTMWFSNLIFIKFTYGKYTYVTFLTPLHRENSSFPLFLKHYF